MDFNLIKDDWKKIPANYRFLILAGSFLIFNSWLLDHWGSENVYLFWGFDIRALGYSVGFTLILFSFLFLVFKQFLYFKAGLMYRKKYPIRKLNKDFFLISFRGYAVLFDKKTKKYHHIVPYETAQDLLFVDQWTYIGKSFPPEPTYLLRVGTSNLSHEFKLFTDGGAINTRT